MTAIVDGVQAKPCVGCSHCCVQAPCAVAQRIYGPVTKCPALVYDHEAKRYWCDLCRKRGDVGAHYREELSVGAGCCSSLNSWRKDIPAPVPPALLQKALSQDARALLRHLANGWISGDALWLAINYTASEMSRKGMDGKQWQKEALAALKQERGRSQDEFMGEVHCDGGP